jgi:hypothetical protein
MILETDNPSPTSPNSYQSESNLPIIVTRYSPTTIDRDFTLDHSLASNMTSPNNLSIPLEPPLADSTLGPLPESIDIKHPIIHIDSPRSSMEREKVEIKHRALEPVMEGPKVSSKPRLYSCSMMVSMVRIYQDFPLIEVCTVLFRIYHRLVHNVTHPSSRCQQPKCTVI